MPRAQDILSGAVLWTSLIILQIFADFDVKQATAKHSGITGDLHVFDRANFLNADWSQEDLVKLRQAMNEHVSRLRVELEEYNFSPRSRRSERSKNSYCLKSAYYMTSIFSQRSNHTISQCNGNESYT
jgi:hypothetical protein